MGHTSWKTRRTFWCCGIVTGSAQFYGGEVDGGLVDLGEADSGEGDGGERDDGEVDGDEADGGEVDGGEVGGGEVDGDVVDSGENLICRDAFWGLPLLPDTHRAWSWEPTPIHRFRISHFHLHSPVPSTD